MLEVCVCFCVCKCFLKIQKVQLLEILSLCGGLPHAHAGSAAAGVFYSTRCFSPWLSQRLPIPPVQCHRHCFPAGHLLWSNYREYFLPPLVSRTLSRLSCGAPVVLLPSGSFLNYPPAFLTALAQVPSADSHRHGTISRFAKNFPEQSCSVHDSTKPYAMPAFLFEAPSLGVIVMICFSSSSTVTLFLFYPVTVVSLVRWTSCRRFDGWMSDMLQICSNRLLKDLALHFWHYSCQYFHV